MSFYQFLLVVVSLGCGTLPLRDGTDLTTSSMASIGLLFGWSILCHLAASQLARGVKQGLIDPIAAANYLNVQLGIFRWLGLMVVTMCLAGFGLAAVVQDTAGLRHSFGLQSIILLMPAFALVAMTASAEFTFMHRIDGGGGGAKVGRGNTMAQRARYVFQQWRSTIAWLAVPVVVLMAVADVIKALPLTSNVNALAIPISAVAMVLFGLPMLTRLIFRVGDMSLEQRQWYEAILRHSGVTGIRVDRWNTGGTSTNALVAGFIPPWRRLWITDRVQDELPAAEVAMVVLHEVGHLRRRHMPLRMLALMPAWAIGWATTHGLSDLAYAEAIGLIVGLTATLVALRLVSHATEYDADRWACETASTVGGGVNGVPGDVADASRALASALRRVSVGQDTSRRTWMHPSTDDRVARLAKMGATNQTNATVGFASLST